MRLARRSAFAGLFLSAPALAFNAADLDAARKLVSQNAYLEALKLLRPCLEEGSEKKIAPKVLEECLALGDDTAGYEMQVAPERDSGQFAKAMQEVGITVQTELYGFTYNHEYLARLQKLFPLSMHADDAAYHVNPDGEHWENKVGHLERYIAAYPKGIHVRSALMWLAMIYDNAWDYTRPDTEDKDAAGYLGTDTGDPKANAEKAEGYWKKAIRYYELLLAHPGDNRDKEFRSHMLEECRARLPELRKRQPSHVVVVGELQD